MSNMKKRQIEYDVNSTPKAKKAKEIEFTENDYELASILLEFSQKPVVFAFDPRWGRNKKRTHRVLRSDPSEVNTTNSQPAEMGLIRAQAGLVVHRVRVTDDPIFPPSNSVDRTVRDDIGRSAFDLNLPALVEYNGMVGMMRFPRGIAAAAARQRRLALIRHKKLSRKSRQFK